MRGERTQVSGSESGQRVVIIIIILGEWQLSVRVGSSQSAVVPNSMDCLCESP